MERVGKASRSAEVCIGDIYIIGGDWVMEGSSEEEDTGRVDGTLAGCGCASRSR